jgi:hypothetical protein
MPVATAAAVRKQIQAGSADSIYLLQGEDEVEKAGLAHEFEELVEEGLRAFNVERIHTGDVTNADKLASAVASLVTAARTLPMMAPRRVVIVLQAQGLLVPKRESDAATRALEDLEDLLKNPDPQTTVVLVGFTPSDDNAHAPNEWMDLGNYETGIRAIARLWDELAGLPR